LSKIWKIKIQIILGQWKFVCEGSVVNTITQDFINSSVNNQIGFKGLKYYRKSPEQIKLI
jgi:hypothetical protein